MNGHHLKPFDCPEVRVQQQLRQGRQLRSPIPPVAAVHQDGVPGLEVYHHVRRSLEESSDVVQPSRVLGPGER